MIELHRQCGGIATLALAVVRRPEAYSRIEMDSDARIRRMRLLKGRGRGDFNDYPKGLTAGMAATPEPPTPFRANRYDARAHRMPPPRRRLRALGELIGRDRCTGAHDV